MSIPKIQAVFKIMNILDNEKQIDLIYQYSIFRSGTDKQKLNAAKAIGAYMIKYISSNTKNESVT